jgi:7-carboxy-7-deazaguanine synthase
LSEGPSRTERLRVNEIFHSLQGEADAVGFPTVFVRLTGCPLRCRYCDTEYAFHAGEWHDVPAIAAKVREFGARHVCVTGGEPLAQPNCLKLLNRLCDDGFEVSLENFALLTARDQLKFVICSRADYDWSRSFIEQHRLAEKCQVLFAPSFNQLSATALADWILADRIEVRFQLQLHKVLWGDVPGK